MGPYPGTSSTDTAGEGSIDPKVMLLVPGSDSDAGWTRSHASAVTQMGQALGIDVTVQYLVDDQSAPDVLAAGTDDGHNVFITASSGYIPSALTHAANQPDARFLSCCGSQSTPNLTSYFGRIYQPLYVAGYVAAKKTCTGRMGVLAAFPNPQFIRHINAFTLGARAANPDITVEVSWLNSFFDLELERSLAEELVSHGNDVLLVQTNTNIAIDVSREASVACGEEPESPVFSVGYHAADMCEAAPGKCLTSAYWNWEPYYTAQVQAMADGSFDPTDTLWQPWLSTADSVVQLTPWEGDASQLNYIPGDIAGEADAVGNDLRNAAPGAPFDGAFHGGTIISSLGTGMIGGNTSLSDEELEDMCWFVEGVVTWDEAEGDWVQGRVPSDCPGETTDPAAG